MSLYKDASLVMIPSAYKDGKLYSIRPTDGSGDFTFSRGSNLAATRVDVNGLIEKGRENLLLQSNQFDTTWVLSGATITGSQSGYDGSNDAWLLTKNTTGRKGVQQSVTSTTGLHTISFYAKAGTLDFIQIIQYGSSTIYQFFDLANGVLGTPSNPTLVIDANIESVGNGWYRCSYTTNATITDVRAFPQFADLDETASSGNIYIQDAQLEAGLVATDYIETGASTAQAGILEDMPRLDYSGSCPALLLEPQRTNLLPQSEFYGGSDWARTRCGFVTNTSETLSPEGLYNASKMTSTDLQESYAQDDILVSGSTSTWSFFAKKGDLDYCHGLVWDRSANGCRQWFNLSTGAVGGTTTFGSGYSVSSASIEDFGNGWYRCTMIVSGTAGANNGYRISLSDYNSSTTSPVNSYGYFYGAQLEDASYPTSYIPTYGSSVTRSADSTSDLDTSSLLTQSNNNTYFAEVINHKNVGNTRWIASYDSARSGSDRILVYAVNSSSGYNMYVQYKKTGASNVEILIGSSLSYGTAYKVAVVFRGTEMTAFLDGVKGTTKTIVESDNYEKFDITDVVSENGVLKQLVAFPTALTDSECIALTTI